MAEIKRRLGITKDDHDAILATFNERLESKVVPEDAQAVIDEEMKKLASLEPSSSEFR